VTTTTQPAQSLERRLGPLDAAALIVSNVIGGGILFSPPQIAASVPSAMLFLSTWLAGGMLAFAGAMAYAELAALRPRAGGEYVYLRAAFGPVAAFLTGWTSFVAGFSGAIATSAVVLAFAGAMAYAELAAQRPRAGGEYVYLRDAFGPPAAFLTGWTSFVAGDPGLTGAEFFPAEHGGGCRDFRHGLDSSARCRARARRQRRPRGVEGDGVRPLHRHRVFLRSG